MISAFSVRGRCSCDIEIWTRDSTALFSNDFPLEEPSFEVSGVGGEQLLNYSIRNKVDTLQAVNDLFFH